MDAPSRAPYYGVLMNWQPSVKTKADLPKDDEVGMARYVKDEGASYVMDEDQTWQLFSKARA